MKSKNHDPGEFPKDPEPISSGHSRSDGNPRRGLSRREREARARLLKSIVLKVCVVAAIVAVSVYVGLNVAEPRKPIE